MTKVAFLGLGAMGFPMAGHLVTKGGHDVTVFNRSAVKRDTWTTTFGARSADTAAAAARDTDFVFSCVGNDDDLRSVTIGPNGAFHSMREGSVFVDHTTASA